jgi:CubicO group peptidase (beta-lactamase class C family)
MDNGPSDLANQTGGDRMRQTFVWCLIAMAAASYALAQPSTITRVDGTAISAAEIDAVMARLMNAAEVTGAGIAVLHGGKIEFLKGYGFRDKEKKLPLTVDSVVSAASFSKVAFAFLAMELVDEGALDLDKPVYQYLPKPLPEYANYADLANDSRYKRITARMLLSHTSGFANWRSMEDDRKLRIHFEPGSRFAYSGEGIDLLQLVVETITKKPLDELMQDRVFQPLGMSRTSMVWQDRFETDYANGYDVYGRSLGPEKRKTPDAAGSMQTTVGDFARFLEAVADGKLLRSKTREQMLSAQVQILSKHEFPTLNNETTAENQGIRLSYGLAWGLYWTPYGKVFFKEGHDDGWRNYAVCFDRQKSGLVIMTNSGNGEGIFKAVLETVLKDTFTPIEWEGYTPYDKLAPRAPLKEHKQVAVEGKVLDRYAGRYELPPNIVLTVRREDDHLSVQENDEAKQDLLPESQTDFFSTASDDAVTFQTDNQGRATAMILHVDGKDILIKRIE